MPLVQSGGLHVTVIGATGAVGEDLVRALCLSPLPMADLRLVASARAAQPTMDVEGKDRPVHVLEDPITDSAVLDGVDLVFFATPPEVTAKLAPTIAEMGPVVVDIGGAMSGRAPLWVPFAGTNNVEEILQLGRVICSPSAAAVALSTLLGPLRPHGAIGCKATVFVSAGLAGRAGIEELSAQVIALFNTRDPPRSVFPSGLAFDILAQVGEVGPEGSSKVEERLVAEVSAITGIEPERLVFTVVAVPTFGGIGLSAFIEMDPLPDLGQVHLDLESVPTLQISNPLPGPKRLVGKSRLHVGRLRADPLGTGIHLVAMGDNLRFGASGNAVAIALQLWRAGLWVDALR